jgi:hypothetical protein
MVAPDMGLTIRINHSGAFVLNSLVCHRKTIPIELWVTFPVMGILYRTFVADLTDKSGVKIFTSVIIRPIDEITSPSLGTYTMKGHCKYTK